MKIGSILITLSILLLFSGGILYLAGKQEDRVGKNDTFRKGLLQVKPEKRNKIFNYFEGKTVERALSFFFVGGGILLLGITLFVLKLPIAGKCMLALLFGGISFIAYQNLNRINKLCKSREYTYRNGQPVTATVISHSKKRVFHSSFLQYVVIAKTNDHKEVHLNFYLPTKRLHNSCPIGSIIHGTELNGEYFFGEMVGIKLVFANDNGEIRTVYKNEN